MQEFFNEKIFKPSKTILRVMVQRFQIIRVILVIFLFSFFALPYYYFDYQECERFFQLLIKVGGIFYASDMIQLILLFSWTNKYSAGILIFIKSWKYNIWFTVKVAFFIFEYVLLAVIVFYPKDLEVCHVSKVFVIAYEFMIAFIAFWVLFLGFCCNRCLFGANDSELIEQIQNQKIKGQIMSRLSGTLKDAKAKVMDNFNKVPDQLNEIAESKVQKYLPIAKEQLDQMENPKKVLEEYLPFTKEKVDKIMKKTRLEELYDQLLASDSEDEGEDEKNDSNSKRVNLNQKNQANPSNGNQYQAIELADLEKEKNKAKNINLED